MMVVKRRTELFALMFLARLWSGPQVHAFHARFGIRVVHEQQSFSFFEGTGISPATSSTGGSIRRHRSAAHLSMTVTTAELMELASAKQTSTAGSSTNTASTSIRITRDQDNNHPKAKGPNGPSRRSRRRSDDYAPRGDFVEVVHVADDVPSRRENPVGNISNGTRSVGPSGAVVGPVDDDLEELGIQIPFGLRQQLLMNARQSIHKRFWIVDNSGSMNILDGHQVLVERGEHTPTNLCTRWSEVQETVQCHARLSAALGAPTDFRLLNPPGVLGGGVAAPLGGLLRGQRTFRVGYGVRRNSQRIARDCRRAQNVMLRTEPNGKTPLADAIAEVRREIVQLRPQLEADGTKVCLVIATDGSNVDRTHGSLENVHHITEEDRQRDVIAALRSLQGLPVVVVIRLCTDHQPLVDFYSTCLDMAQNGDDYESCRDLLEVDIDVLDDHVAEAREVHAVNPWLNYALILHRMREMGQEHRLFDLLDERPFHRTEIRDFVCCMLFGRTSDHRWNVNDRVEWALFVQEVDRWQEREPLQWNPLTKSMAPWIDAQALLAMPP
jgi:hypothetical protein